VTNPDSPVGASAPTPNAPDSKSCAGPAKKSRLSGNGQILVTPYLSWQLSTMVEQQDIPLSKKQ
jgi:hypothetical protein